MDRRRFLTEAGGWALGLLLGAARVAAEEGGPFVPPAYPRAPLPGACQQPEVHTERTLAALLDAVVPGGESDPEGAPGALEGCALNLLLDDAYPFRAYAPMIVTLMDQTAQKEHGYPFALLDLDARVDVLTKAEHTLPLLRLAYRAIRSAFYGGAYNGLGLTYLHYPGPNLGYRHLPEMSLRYAVCKELTETGWLP